MRFSARMALMVGAIFLPDGLSATVLPDVSRQEMPAIRYVPSVGETHIAARLSPNLCVAFSLPQEWRRELEGSGALRLTAEANDGEIEISARSVRDLIELPQADPVTRDAAFLQRDHETLLGRPAQASTLEAVPGATRWTATWIDSSLPSPTHALTIETYIVPASREWLLELSISDIDNRQTYDNLVRDVLSNLRTVSSAQCTG
jgi:hypothetical protein